MHEFEVREEIALDATPEEVWEAIATGPGVDSWFMGRNRIEQAEGGTLTHEVMGQTSTATVTGWEPGRRFAYESDKNPDGTFMAFEYLIEGREGGSTVLRMVHNGFLGDDWEAQYEALKKGDGHYLKKLAAYLRHFPGRTSRFSFLVPGPRVPDHARLWDGFRSALGVTGELTPGTRVRIAVDGVAPADGVIVSTDYPTIPSVCTGDSLYTFMCGYRDTVVVEQHCFADGVDGDAARDAWAAWAARAYA
ncbi:hypothetical protein Ssi03_01490 [Sphaerisporangium siamense]|uniref:Uncharacterized protein YndB with AHSA1/START domain n=1 Tax=Sphaerisporangium siamense TaxID=795645 RepID=A0A7W7GBN7_9ACTN|nr:SRPBCC domain-containing protein [Sphaerisporangium siamense]MBB4703687.1 uncharacterized protein YndB with AHSA1/START domain [Sphaerisporangium siamense]GII82159.1 hypothetical protein Ssi03_01490 [Sphaerisporangium siamense]